MNWLYIFFGAFYVLTFTVLVSKREQWKKAYLAIFLSFVILVAIVDVVLWPFTAWNIYISPRDDTKTFHRLRLVDANGTEHVFDRRALPVRDGAPFRGLAGPMATIYNKTQNQQLACFILEQAEEYRNNRLNYGSWSIDRILHGRRNIQIFGPQWREPDIGNSTRFSHLRLYRIESNIRANGTEKKETLIEEYTCS